METYIFPIPEIECMIFDYLNLRERYGLTFINKYFYESISSEPLHKEMKEFHRVNGNYGIKYLRRYIIIKSQYKSNNSTNNFYIACSTGLLLVAKYYLEDIYYQEKLSITRDKIFSTRLRNSILPIVCENGHFEILKWLEKIDHEPEFYIYESSFVSSCLGGHLEIAKYLYSKNKECMLDYDPVNSYIFSQSCANGHLDIIEYLVSISNLSYIHANNEAAFRRSCENGHIGVVKYLISLDGKINIHTMDEAAFRMSCRNGHLDVAKYLISLDGKIDIRTIGYYAFKKSCKNGHINVVKYLVSLMNQDKRSVSLNPSKNANHFRNYIVKFGCFKACRNGHIEIVKYLLSINNNINIYEVFYKSCIYGHIEIAKCLFHRKNFVRKNQINNLNWLMNSDLFVKSCENGHIEIVKLLYELINKIRHMISLNLNYHLAFTKSCINGHSEIAKLIYQTSSIFGWKFECGSFSGYITCKRHNDLETTKFIYSLNKKLPTHEKMTQLFQLSCEYGNLEMAKWIYYKCLHSSAKINIKQNNDIAFRMSCENGHIEVAKWLYSIDNKINHFADDKYAFQKSCTYDHTEVARWLVTICPDKYYVSIINNKIYEWKLL